VTAPDLPQVTHAGAARGRAAGNRAGRLGPRVVLRGAFVGLAMLVLVVLLVGCGNAALPEAPPTSGPPVSAPPSTGPTTASPPPVPSGAPTPAGEPARPAPAPTGGADGTPGAPPPPQAVPEPRAEQDVPLWPAGDTATAQRMQQQADRGGDPWLLDPREVTISYVGAELGYRDPTLTELAPGVHDVTDGRSPARATVTLEQTVRGGPGGIWLVTAVTRH